MDGTPPTEDRKGGPEDVAAATDGLRDGVLAAPAGLAPELVPAAAPLAAEVPALALEQAQLKGKQTRGASDAQLDQLRATVKVSARGAAGTASRPPFAPRSQPPPQLNAGELTLLVDEGRALIEDNPAAAHQKFATAYRRNLNDVRVLSYYGLTLVVVEGDRQRGIRFCEEAVRRGPLTTELLVNLAKALVLTRNKEQAVRALRKAQELAPDDPRVGREFLALGLRRKPPIPFLPRAFFLNKWIGLLTWRLAREKDAPLGALR
ncbi:MAG: hypothetical protein NVSMB23_08360 [Myxococcales bacterium]